MTLSVSPTKWIHPRKNTVGHSAGSTRSVQEDKSAATLGADPVSRSPALVSRVLVAAVLSVAAFALAFGVRATGHYTFSDFDQLWIAARAILAHRDPYAMVSARQGFPLFYPMPAVVLAIPFAGLPITVAGPVFVAIGMGALAYALSARGWWPVLLLATEPAISAVVLCQWSPLLTAAAILPPLRWTLLGKPTSGGAIVAAYASRGWLRWNLALGGSVLALSFLLWPTWVSAWLAAVRSAHHFVPLVLRPGGALMLLALLRWRRTDARLLALLSSAPLTLAAYDALPLVLIPQTRNEVLTLAAGATIAQRIMAQRPDMPFLAWTAQGATTLLVCCFLPALLMVLRRPNVSQWRNVS